MLTIALLSRFGIAWLMLLALVALGAGLGLRDPSPPDEPRFALAARHMVDSGDWLIPRRGSELYAHKPPLFMWSQAGAYLATGNWRVAFLLPSLLAALGTLWLTYDIGRTLWSRRVGVIAASALLATLQFGLQAKRAQIDMLLVLLTTLALWGLVRHLLRGPDRAALLLGALAAGLGTVTKGVGFLPLLVLLPWLWVRRSLPGARKQSLWLVPLGFLAGVAVWVLPILLTVASSKDPALQAYAAEIFLKQTGERYANAWHHIRPAWYYLQVIATLWLPGALLLPWLLPGWWRRLRRGDARYWLLLGWALLVLLFFSASPGKREVYLFPALPAVCLAAAPLLCGLLRRPGPRRLLLGYVIVLATLAMMLILDGNVRVDGVVSQLAARRDIRADDLRWLLGGLGALSAGGLALAAALHRKPGHLAIGFSAWLWAVYGLVLAPALDASSSARQLMATVEARLAPESQLGLVAWREQMLLQAKRPAVDFGFSASTTDQWKAAAIWLSQDPRHRWVLAPESAMPSCLAMQKAVFVGQSNRGRWWLVPSESLGADCPESAPPHQSHSAGHPAPIRSPS